MDVYHYLELLLIPVTNIVTWFSARRKRRNDAISEMQGTVDMLVLQNKTLYKELVDTRRELAEARTKIDILEGNQERLLKENAELRAFIEKKTK